MSDGRSRNSVVRRVGKALLRFMQQIDAVNEQSAQSSDMHQTDFRAICLLGGNNVPMSPKEIGHALGLTSGAVSALILRLEVGGMVVRKPNPEDRRGVLISLDKEAAARPLQEYVALHACYTQITDEFTSTELEVVARYLEALRHVTATHLTLEHEKLAGLRRRAKALE